MDVSGIGVQTISTTTGTAGQNPSPSPVQANDNNDENAPRVNPPAATGTGNIVDKIA